MTIVSLQFLLEGFIIFNRSQIQKAFLGVLLTLSNTALAQSPVSDIEFIVKPRLCVLAEHEERCEDELDIRWTALQPRSLCLLRSDNAQPLHCWEHQLNGQYSLLLSTANNVDFHLREMTQNTLLISQEYEVMQDQSQYRRRRRNPWSFF